MLQLMCSRSYWLAISEQPVYFTGFRGRTWTWRQLAPVVLLGAGAKIGDRSEPAPE